MRGEECLPGSSGSQGGLGVPGNVSAALRGQQVMREMLAKRLAKAPGRGTGGPGTG